MGKGEGSRAGGEDATGGAGARAAGPSAEATLAGPVVLVVSPHAGRGEGAARAERALRAPGVAVGERIVVSELDRVRAQGIAWRGRGWSAAVAAGGDGTVCAVASHVAGSGLPLGILPLGTSNDTARSLGIPLDLEGAARVIAGGESAIVDAGQAVPALTEPLALAADAPPGCGRIAEAEGLDAPASALGAYFLHALTLGFNAEFARLATDVARRQRLGPLTYAASLVEALASYKPTRVTLRFAGLLAPEGGGEDAHDATVTCEALQIAAVNTPVFGGAMNLRLPDVELRDALLDFVVIEALDPDGLRRTVDGLLAALGRLPEALHERAAPEHTEQGPRRLDEALGLALPGIRRFKARAATIEAERPLDVTLDGEVRTRTPVLARVAPEPIWMLLPAGARAALGCSHEQLEG